jgi:ribosomal protein S18 acetylase RimI-like enzyme
LTADLRVRAATEADADAVGAIWASARAVAYAGIVPDEIARRPAEAVSEGFGSWITEPERFGLIALDGDRSVGFVVAGRPEHDDGDGDAEISLIYVAPHAQGRGVGRLLMCHAVRRLRAAGNGSLFLWALRENRSGAAFYERLGGSVLREVWSEKNRTFLVVYGWRDLDALVDKTCTKAT